LNFVIQVHICKIIFHVFLSLFNYYIILDVNSPPALVLGEGLTIPHRKNNLLRNVTKVIGIGGLFLILQ